MTTQTLILLNVAGGAVVGLCLLAGSLLEGRRERREREAVDRFLRGRE